jgi:hypothetical protein
MKAFIILCHNPTNLISKGIRLVTGSFWNHGAILYNGYVYEFNINGKVVTRLSDWNYNGITQYREVNLVVNPNDVNGYYDFGVFVNEALFYLTGWEYFTNRNDENKWYCFEYLAYCMGLDNSHMANGKDFESLT